MNTIRYDFRSDTVTRPSAGMRAAMAEAEVGDDVFGDDPTVNRLEQRMAAMLGKDAAIFVPSGTQSNLLALMSHCGRGDEYIAGPECASLQPSRPAAPPCWARSSRSPLRIRPMARWISAISKAPSSRTTTTMPARRVIALENTFGGKVLPVDYMAQVAEIARRHGLGLHLDGARAFNAVRGAGHRHQDASPRRSTACRSASPRVSGAPVGSVLIGRQDLIDTARRHRKMLGGGMRQSGILAAAGLYALDNNVDRLAEDHRRARRLAEGLAAFPSLKVVMPDTNIVFVDVEERLGEKLHRLPAVARRRA